MTTQISIIEDNAGQYTLTDGTHGWQAFEFAQDRAVALDGAQAWQSGEWEPSENDGWRAVDLAGFDFGADHDAPRQWALNEFASE